jgi:hypothetical protein
VLVLVGSLQLATAYDFQLHLNVALYQACCICTAVFAEVFVLTLSLKLGQAAISDMGAEAYDLQLHFRIALYQVCLYMF